VTQRRPAQGGVYQQCVCREVHCWPVFRDSVLAFTGSTRPSTPTSC
jgi:hypothetical protein